VTECQLQVHRELHIKSGDLLNNESPKYYWRTVQSTSNNYFRWHRVGLWQAWGRVNVVTRWVHNRLLYHSWAQFSLSPIIILLKANLIFSHLTPWLLKYRVIFQHQFAMSSEFPLKSLGGSILSLVLGWRSFFISLTKSCTELVNSSFFSSENVFHWVSRSGWKNRVVRVVMSARMVASDDRLWIGKPQFYAMSS